MYSFRLYKTRIRFAAAVLMVQKCHNILCRIADIVASHARVTCEQSQVLSESGLHCL